MSVKKILSTRFYRTVNVNIRNNLVWFEHILLINALTHFGFRLNASILETK